jgi:hypothetical protein
MKKQDDDDLEYQDLWYQDKDVLAKIGKRVGIVLAVVALIVLIFWLLPFIFNHTADTILAYKNIQKAVKA